MFCHKIKTIHVVWKEQAGKSKGKSAHQRFNGGGASHGIARHERLQLLRMVAAETMTYVVCGIVVGCAVGLPLNWKIYNNLVTVRWGGCVVCVFRCSRHHSVGNAACGAAGNPHTSQTHPRNVDRAYGQCTVEHSKNGGRWACCRLVFVGRYAVHEGNLHMSQFIDRFRHGDTPHSLSGAVNGYSRRTKDKQYNHRKRGHRHCPCEIGKVSGHQLVIQQFI